MTMPDFKKSGVGAAIIAVLIILPLLTDSGFAITIMSQIGVAIIFALIIAIATRSCYAMKSSQESDGM